MRASLILYGSRARGEAVHASDVDLILAEDGKLLRRPRISNGVSVHWYAKDWLRSEALAGNLFVYHVAFEGKSLVEGCDLLSDLQGTFQKRHSYKDDIETAALILRMVLETDWKADRGLRQRYFWALRTMLICRSADLGTPKFSATALEGVVNIHGLAEHIHQRSEASYRDCVTMGAAVSKECAPFLDPNLAGTRLRDHLLGLGGIAFETVRLIEEEEAVKDFANRLYL
jgi:hypothetical protein